MVVRYAVVDSLQFTSKQEPKLGGAGVYPQNFNSKKRSKEMVQENNYAALLLQEWITCLDGICVDELGCCQ